VSENLNHECMCSKLNVILTDGTSILGLGNIGPVPGLPVMEAKSMIFKLLGNVNVVPVCINARKSPQEAMRAIMDLIHLYKAINL
jgi:malate dehydrogenase (oxaloacetate-decarboxylating)